MQHGTDFTRNIGEKAVSILAGNSNSGLSYLITTVTTCVLQTSKNSAKLMILYIQHLHILESTYVKKLEVWKLLCERNTQHWQYDSLASASYTYIRKAPI